MTQFFLLILLQSLVSCKTTKPETYNDPFTSNFFTGFTSFGSEASCYAMTSPCPKMEPAQSTYQQACNNNNYRSFVCSCSKVLCSNPVPGYKNPNGISQDGVTFTGYTPNNKRTQCIVVGGFQNCPDLKDDPSNGQFVDSCSARGGQFIQCADCSYLCTLSNE